MKAIACFSIAGLLLLGGWLRVANRELTREIEQLQQQITTLHFSVDELCTVHQTEHLTQRSVGVQLLQLRRRLDDHHDRLQELEPLPRRQNREP